MKSGMCNLDMNSYCGMFTPLEVGDLDDCRDAAALVIRQHRRSGRDVSVLKPGRKWEMLENENGAMVNDDEGILSLTGGEDE